MKNICLVYNRVLESYYLVNNPNPYYPHRVDARDMNAIMGELGKMTDPKKKCLLSLVDVNEDTMEELTQRLRGTKIILESKSY